MITAAKAGICKIFTVHVSKRLSDQLASDKNDVQILHLFDLLGLNMQIVFADVGPIGSCQARKIPTSAPIDTPKKDFAGIDTGQIEVYNNSTERRSYRIRSTLPLWGSRCNLKEYVRIGAGSPLRLRYICWHSE